MVAMSADVRVGRGSNNVRVAYMTTWSREQRSRSELSTSPEYLNPPALSHANRRQLNSCGPIDKDSEEMRRSEREGERERHWPRQQRRHATPPPPTAAAEIAPVARSPVINQSVSRCSVRRCGAARAKLTFCCVRPPTVTPPDGTSKTPAVPPIPDARPENLRAKPTSPSFVHARAQTG